MPVRIGGGNGFIRLVVDDNTKPFARMGRKAYGSRLETAGLPKYHTIFGPGFSVSGRGKFNFIVEKGTLFNPCFESLTCRSYPIGLDL
jgi:hypothetical protein